MARTYREAAIEEMLRTVEEAMSQVIDWWGDLPPPMKEAIEQFRIQLGRQLIPWNLLKGHSTEKYMKPTTGRALNNACHGARVLWTAPTRRHQGAEEWSYEANH